jgi:ribosomal protein S18 acetylase RimI-like enzyme
MTSTAAGPDAARPSVQEPLLGDTTPNTSAPSPEFLIRPGRLADIPSLAFHSTRAYWRSAVNRFIAPHAERYPDDLSRHFRQSMRRRVFKPNYLFLVACKASDPDTAVGYGQFARLGNDAAAKELVSSTGLLQRMWMWIFSWIFWAYDTVDLFVWRPHAFDPNALSQLAAWNKRDSEKHWVPYPERKNKWYAQSLVINPDYQGRGLGTMLMAEPMKRAQRERVVFGLTASPHGEFLYRKLGFEMLGEFCERVPTEGPGDEGGGIMIWYPEGWEGNRHTD